MYSAVPWPKWDVAPGLLTAHGYQLMRLFGAWDRVKYSGEGLLAPSGCADAAHVTIIADTDKRLPRECFPAATSLSVHNLTAPVIPCFALSS
jgi:hypothetical protein